MTEEGMSPEYQQLSSLMASLMEELLAIKARVVETEELRDQIWRVSNAVDDLANKLGERLDEKLDKGSMHGQVYYRDIDNRLWLADSDCHRPYQTGFEEPHLIRHGARQITLAGAIKLGWPAFE